MPSREPPIADPAMVPDTFADGLHSVTYGSDYVRLTFFKTRPDDDVIDDGTEREVVGRVIMPHRAYHALRRIVGDARMPTGERGH